MLTWQIMHNQIRWLSLMLDLNADDAMDNLCISVLH